MKTIKEIYEPYNFSNTSCYVFRLDIGTKDFIKIEHKIPEYVKNLTGIFVSISGTVINEGSPKVAGFISLNFNGQSLKCFQANIPQTYFLNDCSRPIAFDETIISNSFVQGYYFGYPLNFLVKVPHRVSIYLHYKP